MKRYLLSALICCFSLPAFSQGMYGFQAGLGFNTGGYHSKKTPAIEGYYLHKIIPGLYGGISLMHQRYSVTNNVSTASTLTYGDVVSVNQKSSFVFLCPKIDYGFGTRKYFHVHFTFGPGFYAGGKQTSDTHSPYWTPPGGAPFGADTLAVNTTYNIPATVMRYGFGLSQRIPTNGYWNITLSEEYSVPGGISDGPYPFKTSYFCFTVGIMHKYPMVFVEY